MTNKNTVRVTYEGAEEFGRQYVTGRTVRLWLNGTELEGVTGFKYEVGVNDIMKVTLKLIVAEIEVERVSVDTNA